MAPFTIAGLLAMGPSPGATQQNQTAQLLNMLHDSFRKSDELLETLKKEINNG